MGSTRDFTVVFLLVVGFVFNIVHGLPAFDDSGTFERIRIRDDWNLPESGRATKIQIENTLKNYENSGLCFSYKGLDGDDSRSTGLCRKYCDKQNKRRSEASIDAIVEIESRDDHEEAKEKMGGVSCYGNVQGVNGQATYIEDENGKPFTTGVCKCDVPEIAKEITLFVGDGFEALQEAIKEGLETLCAGGLAILKGAIDMGISFIPGVGPTIKGVQVSAKLIKAAKDAYENGVSGADFFDKGIEKACGKPPPFDFSPEGLFQALVDLPDSSLGGAALLGCKLKKASDCKTSGKKDDPKEPKSLYKGKNGSDEAARKEAEDRKKKADDDKKKKEEEAAKHKTPTKTPPPEPVSNPLQNHPTKTTAPKACNLKRAQQSPELFHIAHDPRDAMRGVRSLECQNGKTTTHEFEITSIRWVATPTALPITATCDDAAGQACHHYQSAIHVNPEWKTLTCPGLGAAKRHERDAISPAVKSFYAHVSTEWREQEWRVHKDVPTKKDPSKESIGCQADEFPPHYLLAKDDTAWKEGGKTTKGQLIRYMPHNENKKGGEMWQGKCFWPVFEKYNAQQLWDKATKHGYSSRKLTSTKSDLQRKAITIPVDYRPTFSIDFKQSGQDKPDAKEKLFGLKTELNKCLPSLSTGRDGKSKFDDPGFALLRIDPYNVNKKNTWDYTDSKPGKPTQPGTRDLWVETELVTDRFETNDTFFE